MAEFRLSTRAEADVTEIADYTIERFGIEQARRYRDDLAACFQDIAEHPRIGRSAEWLAPRLRRFEYRSHTVFYTEEDDAVLIIRVLHARMDPQRHSFAPVL